MDARWAGRWEQSVAGTDSLQNDLANLRGDAEEAHQATAQEIEALAAFVSQLPARITALEQSREVLYHYSVHTHSHCISVIPC